MADEYDYEETESAEEPDAEPENEFSTEDELEEEPKKLPASNHAEHMELVDGRRLRPTLKLWLLFGLGGLLAGAAAVLYWVGLNLPAWTLWAYVAGGGAALIILVAAITSLLVNTATKGAYIDCSREVELPKEVRVGDVFEATLDATKCRFGGARVLVRETPMSGFVPMGRTKMRGAGKVTYEVRAGQRGPQKFRGVDVLFTDSLGLWIQERRYKLETEVEVIWGPEAMGLRAQIMGQTAFLDGTPKAMTHIFRDVETEMMHDYGPGDRMKDVDWKLYGKTGQMVVREKKTETATHAMLLFDCGTSMLMPRKGYRSIDIAIDMAHEIIGNATDRTIACGYFAFDDNKAIDSMVPTKKRSLSREMVDRFAYMTDPVRPKKETEPTRKILQEQTIDAAFALALKRGLGAKTNVLLFTDLDSINDRLVQLVAKVAQGGVKTGVVLLPHPTYGMKKRFRRAGGKAPNGFRGAKVRKELREVLVAQDVEFLDLRWKFDLIEEQERLEKERAEQATKKVVAA